MKKLLLKSLALLLTLTFLLSAASLAISVAAASYISGVNNVSSSYAGSKYYSNLNKIPLTGNNRADVLAVALSQLRYREGAGLDYMAGTNGNGTGNFTEYNYNFGNLGGYAYAWCAAFVTWSLRQSGVNKVGTGINNSGRNHLGDKNYIWAEASCGYWVSQLTKCGYFQISKYRGGTYTPKSGDIIFFENSTNYSWSDHVGLVVYATSSTVYTVEGNTSSGTGLNGEGGGVYFKSYALNSSRITGYGAMPYNTTSSPIDYSGANPTTGLYIGVNSAKNLYASASESSSILTTIPGGTVFEATSVTGTGIGSSFLKVTYNGTTGYVANNTDRVIQLTQTTPSSGSSGGGTSGGGSSMTQGTAGFAAVIGALGIDGGALTAVNGMTANLAIVNPYAYNGTATTIDWQGYAMINGGQTDSFVYSVDGGSTWKGATVSATADGDTSMDSTVLALSGLSSWTNLGTAGSSAYTHAHFIVHTDLSSHAGKTVDVILGRTGTDNTVYKIAKIEGVSVPAASSGGDTTTPTDVVYYTGLADSINGESLSDFYGTQISQQSHVFNAPATSLNIAGWCAMAGGQGDMYYTTDGGTTWKALTNSATQNSAEYDAILAVAKSKSGAPSSVSWGTDQDYRYNVTIDLSSYAGKTISALTLGRKANSDGKVYPMFHVTNVSVPSAASGGNSGTGSGSISGTVTMTGTASAAWPYVTNISTINGLGSDGKALASDGSNSWNLSGYRTSSSYTANPKAITPAVVDASTQGVSVSSSKTISINGWGIVNGGQQGYVYSIDGTNWYSCTGTLSTSTADISAITSLVTSADGYALWQINSTSAANCIFTNLTASLAGCEGSTVNLMFGIRPDLSDTAICHFMTINNLYVPSGSTTVTPPSSSSGTVTNTAVPTIHSCSWTTYTTNGVVALKCNNGCGKTIVPTEYLDPADIMGGMNMQAGSVGANMTNHGSYVTVGTAAGASAPTPVTNISVAELCAPVAGSVTNGGSYARYQTSTTEQQFQYINANMKQYLVVRVKSNMAAEFGVSYYSTTTSASQLLFTTLTADNEYHTYVFDLKTDVPSDQIYGIAPDWKNIGATVDVSDVASFSSATDANNYASYLNGTLSGSGYTSNQVIQFQGTSVEKMGQYMLVKYKTQSNHNSVGAYPNFHTTYWDNTYGWIDGAYNNIGSISTTIIDMKEPMSASSQTAHVFSFQVDTNGKAPVDIYYIATFSSKSDAEFYQMIVEGGGCSHSSTSAATTAQSATCGATGYTAGTKCNTCGYVTEQPETVAATTNHSWSANTCTHASRRCSICGATQPGTLDHYDNNGDKACDACTISMGSASSGSTGGANTSGSASNLAGVVNYINDVGPGGTAEDNYAAQLISTGSLTASVPVIDVIKNSGYISLDGWCMINGGQKNVIKYSTDGGNTWLGTCTGTTFSDGDSSLSQMVVNFVSMPSPVVTGAWYENARVDISALGGAYSVTFGREGADGNVYPFATITGLSDGSSCAHANCNISTATCDTAKVCNDCGMTVQAALGHDMKEVAAKAATCSENGNTAGQTCSRCSTTTTTTIFASGHIYNTYVAGKDPTCTETGLTSSKKCNTCSQLETPQTVIPATGHDTANKAWVNTNSSVHYKLCSCGVKTDEAAHTMVDGKCSVCGYGCEHTPGSAPSCTQSQVCTKCQVVLNAALGHNYADAYMKNDSQHWKVCLRCSATSETADHSYTANKCVCGHRNTNCPDYHSSVDWINGVGPNNDTTTPYSSTGGSTSVNQVSVPVPFSTNVTYLRITGWTLAIGGVQGYKWSVGGEAWNDCTAASFANAIEAHYSASAASGVGTDKMSDTISKNALFNGLCADLTAYAGQTVDVSFAAVGAGGEIIPIVTITGVNAGAPDRTAYSFDSYYVGGTQQSFGDATVNGVTVSGSNKDMGTLTMSNLTAGTPVTLWGWIGYEAPITSFGYYFNNYTNDIKYVPTTEPEDAVLGAGGQYAKRMRIDVDTSSISGNNNTVTFVAIFADGSVAPITTWALNVSGASSSVTAPADGSGQISNQYANVIIISGQSNAYGATPIDMDNYNLQSVYKGKTYPNIKLHYTNINGGGSLSDQMRVIYGNSGFETYTFGLGGGDANAVGPEFGLAEYLSANYTNGEQFYIIKFTAAGTFLNGDWLPGDADYMAYLNNAGFGGYASRPHASSHLGDYLFNHMIADIQTSIANIQATTSLPVKIHSFMWVQGESDGCTQSMAVNYQAREAQLVTSLRNAFPQYAAAGGISFVNYQIVEKNMPGTTTPIWACAPTLNASKQANAQYMFNVASQTLGTQKSTYGIGKSVLLDKTDWDSKAEMGHSSNDPYHLEAYSMMMVGKSFGAAMAAMNGKSISHVHSTVTTPAVDATCSTSGLTEGITCIDCNGVLKQQTIIPAKGHTYDNDSDMNCNTCGELRGSESCSHSFDSTVYVNNKSEYHYNACTLCGAELNIENHKYDAVCDPDCNICGYTRSVTHTISTIAATQATCLVDGVSQQEGCTVCGLITVAGTTTPKLSHSFTSTSVVAATCTEKGYTLHKCVNGCERSYKTNYTNATGHNYTVTVVAPTCSDLGYTSHTCACGNTYNSDPILANGHTYAAYAVVAPTCNAQGYTQYHCQVTGCDAMYNSDYTAAGKHSYVAVVTAPTCLVRGYTTYSCACGESYVSDTTSATGHTYAQGRVFDPTCSSLGYTLYECACGSEYRSDFTAPSGHKYSSTTDADGVTTHTCTGGCGSKYFTSEKGQHEYTSVTIAPTCTTEGYTTFTCNCGCGNTYNTNYVSATGHTYTKNTVAPTCDNGGYTLYSCACGHSYQGDFVAATGHTLVQTGRVYPTMTTVGYTSYKCSNCSHTEAGNYIDYYNDLIGGSAYVSSQKGLTPIAQGLDVSYWQNSTTNLVPFDFVSAKAAGIDYVIIRAGTTNMKDPAFEMNYADAKAAGLDVGVYFYTYASTVAGAQADANKLLTWLEGKTFEYPIYYDVENDAQKNVGKETLKTMINSFMEIMQSNGYYTSLYIYQSFILSYTDFDYTVSNYDIWMAQYPFTTTFDWTTDTPPTWNNSKFAGTFGMWQFCSTGRIPGYSGNLDSNLCWKDYPTLIKSLGLNGYTQGADAGSDTAPTQQYVWVKSSVTSLNVRSSPDFTSSTNIITSVPGGTRLVLLEKASSYVKVLYNGSEAYISANTAYVQFTDPNA